MRNNEEKSSYALDPLIVRDWELKANGIRLEELLAAYAQQQRSDIQALEWFTATNTRIGIAYTYGLHPNASAGRPLQYALELLDAPDNPAAGCFFTEVAIGRLTRYL